MNEHNKFPLVMIEWYDSLSSGGRWRSVFEMHDMEPFICRSVGWLVVDGETKVIVPHLYDSDEEYNTEASGCGEMAIPGAAVKSISVLMKCPEESEFKIFGLNITDNGVIDYE